MTSLRFLSCFLVCCLVPCVSFAQTKLPSIFGDHMVLQREKAIPVWGWDQPGTDVTVTLGEQSVTVAAGDDGKWSASLKAMDAGGPFELKVKGSEERVFKDVLIGEVWLCSGQSNMEWTVNRSKDAKAEIANADFPKIRHIKFQHVPAAKPLDDAKVGGWKICDSENVPNFTAVGYYFGRHLHRELDVPIGLIGSNWGGTRIEPWTPPAGFKAIDELSEIAGNLDEFPKVNKAGKVIHQSPLALYNGMINPIVPFAMRGAIWYQGESNNGEGMLYHHKMKALIHGWRTVWNDPEMPFYFVQLAPYRYRRPQALPGIWEAQTATLSVPHTGMAVTVDIGNINDIHPKNKQDVGKRLAKWALAKNYGKTDLVYCGPLFKSMTVEGKVARLSFDHVGSGLVSRNGEALTHFTVAGEDKKFVDAVAKIDGESVVVQAEGVDKPVAVRFGWDELAEPNLSNKEGLPASPFRTDRW